MQTEPRIWTPPKRRLVRPTDRDVARCSPLGGSFSFGLAGRAGKAASSFDPTTLALTAYWRADYGGSPWVGTASAGTSGSNDATHATNAPSVGTAVDGFDPAEYNGTNNQLDADGTLATYVSTSAYSGWALINAASIATDNASAFENDAVFMAADATLGLVLRSSGLVVLHHYDGATSSVSTSFSTSAWTFVQFKFGSGSFTIRTNNGSWATPVSIGNLVGLTPLVRLGRNYTSAYFAGKKLELALTDTTLSDSTFDDVYSYAKARYPSAGLP